MSVRLNYAGCGKLTPGLLINNQLDPIVLTFIECKGGRLYVGYKYFHRSLIFVLLCYN